MLQSQTVSTRFKFGLYHLLSCDHDEVNLISASLSLNLQNGNDIRTNFIGLNEIRNINGIPSM